jgi:hypothetical protein
MNIHGSELNLSSSHRPRNRAAKTGKTIQPENRKTNSTAGCHQALTFLGDSGELGFNIFFIYKNKKQK